MKRYISWIAVLASAFGVGYFLGHKGKVPPIDPIPEHVLKQITDETSVEFFKIGGPYYISWDEKLSAFVCSVNLGTPWNPLRHRYVWRFNPIDGSRAPGNEIAEQKLRAEIRKSLIEKGITPIREMEPAGVGREIPTSSP